MKENIQCAIVLTICLALIPCLAFVGRQQPQDGFTVGVYLTEEGRVEEYTMEDYLVGAVLAQMPAEFHEEALKAQAVLARTYITGRYESERDSPTPALHGALISDDERIYQSFFSPRQAEVSYGSDYEKLRNKVLRAVRSAPGILTYEDEPAIAAYHSASSGNTESAQVAWGQDIPYLQSVESSSDADLKGIETKTTVGLDEFRRIAEEQLGIVLTGSPEGWLTAETNERSYATAVYLGGSGVNVQRFISAMGIASPCFTFEVNDSGIVFTAQGFGHLVGMSQYGANTMAEQGSSFEEILTHYYRGCKLTPAPL